MPEFRTTDRRSSARGGPSGLIVPTSAQTTAALRGRLPREGMALPAPGRDSRRQGLGPDSELEEVGAAASAVAPTSSSPPGARATRCSTGARTTSPTTSPKTTS
jgi:hypothetical protein